MKVSKYNISILGEHNVALYNLLNKNLILVENNDFTHLNTNSLDKLDNEYVLELKKLGFLIDNDLDEVQLMKFKINKGKFHESTMNLFLSLTSNCNLRCTYCYEDSCRTNNSQNKFITDDQWKKVFEFIKNESFKLNNLNIVLFGGEPLLDIDHTIKIINDLNTLKTNNLNLSISIITNGITLNKTFLSKINDLVSMIQITIDGPKKIHNTMRIFPNGSGSFDLVYKNFIESANSFKGKTVLRINVTKNSTKFLYPFLEELKINKINEKIFINIHPIFDNQSNISINGCRNDFDDDLLFSLNELYYYLSKNNFKFEKTFIEGPCMAKHCNSFVIDENSNIYNCPGILYTNSCGKINDDQQLEFNNTSFYKQINEENLCINDCNYAPICYGGCNWQNKCNKHYLDITLKSQLKSYLISKYNFIEKREILDENSNKLFIQV